MRQYDHTKIEKKWQNEWAKKKIATTSDKVKGKKNFYLLVEFPYPSGNLHVGHWYAFALPDIRARFERMTGKNVLFPIGFDAFGLPAENAAIKRGLNPRKWTGGNIAFMRKQIQSMGTLYDWSREVQTIDPNYYRWTQWLFLQFFKKGLAYKKETAVNWCPKDKTVLANEQVVNGKCERCSAEVEQRNMLQWNLKITDYADRLVDDLTTLDWPEQIKESQRNWIGRSEGAEIDFCLDFGKKYKYVILHGFAGAPDHPRWIYVKQELEKLGHEVVIPRLPNPNNPQEEEWVETALNAIAYDENTVLCGHSLGAVTALKVLERLGKPIARLVTVGGFTTPEFHKGHRHPFDKTWDWNFDGKTIRKNVGSTTILHDPKDEGITNIQAQKLSDLLETPITLGQSTKSHFTGDKEPDVLMWLRPTIRVFTTRPDTLFGATYLVLAPEHPMIAQCCASQACTNKREVEEYVKAAGKKTELERQENKEKTGVKLEGVEATNPATGERIPLYVADYVLAHYGTGAIMAVPAHDERDNEFAKKFNLPIRTVVEPISRVSRDSPMKDGLPIAKREVVCAVVKNPKDGTYLCIEWSNIHMHGLVTGGVEAGEDIVEAAKREVHEETGYKSLKLVHNPGLAIHSLFFHRQKQINRWGRFQYLFFELENEERDTVAPEEAEKHIVVWKSRKELQNYFTVIEGEFVLSFIDNPKFIFTGHGILQKSGDFTDMDSEEAKKKITEKFGSTKTTYKMRDWVVSRQRYWGVPIPIIHCGACGDVAVPDKDLPVKLPEVKDYLPTGDGKSPLAKVKKFVQAKCPQCKGKAERETDTFDTFVDSSWYFQRYTDPKNKKKFADPKRLSAWMPVDLYSGGAEHTTMHLLYSRFWHKAMYDLKLVKNAEPYARRMNRSLIMGPDGQKMSKSRGNVIDPDEVVKKLGADTVRMYLAFIGPYNEVASYPWNQDGVAGVRRFLERVWRLHERLVKEQNSDVERAIHLCAKKVTDDMPQLKFNTSIAAMMTFLNDAEGKGVTKRQYLVFLRLLAPFAPHISEELWCTLGNKKSIHLEKWPKYDPKKIAQHTATIVVQVNGKIRAQIIAETDGNDAEIKKGAEKAVAKWLEGQTIRKTIHVPNRLVNFVV